jgi:hypothetical protein
MDEILIKIIRATVMHLPARVMAEVLSDLESYREVIIQSERKRYLSETKPTVVYE